MTVFTTYLKRIFARPWTILLSIAIPALIVALSLMASYGIIGDDGTGIRVALFDHDDSTLSRMVTDAMTPVSTFVEIDENEIDEALLDNRIEYALVLPESLQERVLNGERAELKSYSLGGIAMTASVESAANAVLSAAHNVARTVQGDQEAFLRAMALTNEGSLTVRTETFRSERAALSAEGAAGVTQLVGLMTMTMLALIAITCMIFLKDIENGTLHRSLVGPMTIRRYMIETNAAFFIATVLQGVVTAAVIGVIFRQLPIAATLMLGLVFTAFSLVTVSLALAIANITKKVRRTQVTINFLIVPMAMLGGAFWPIEFMPIFLQRVSNFTPITWVTGATQEILSGARFTDILPHLGILLLFAVVFQFLSSWRRVDIAK